MTGVIEATSVRIQTMADSTLRLTVDIEPRFANEAFQLFGKVGQPIALAALKPATSKPEKAERERLGPLCQWAVMRCKEPEFQKWLCPTPQGCLDVDEAGVASHIRGLFNIESRKELDTNEKAAAAFNRTIRLPYAAWLKKQGETA